MQRHQMTSRGHSEASGVVDLTVFMVLEDVSSKKKSSEDNSTLIVKEKMNSSRVSVFIFLNEKKQTF